MIKKLTYAKLMEILERNSRSLERVLLALSNYFYCTAIRNDIKSGEITEVRFQGNLYAISEEMLLECQSDWRVGNTRFYELTLFNKLTIQNHANEGVFPKLIFTIAVEERVSDENHKG